MAEIRCVRGTVLVDDDDLPMLLAYGGWFVVKKDNVLYAVCNKYEKQTKTNRRVYMHRLLVPGHPQVDHIDGNGLNNSRANLRGCQNAENIRNRVVQKNSRSGVRGVYWHKQRGKWCAAIRHQRKQISLGLHDSIESARAAYLAKAKELWGADDLARLLASNSGFEK